jgi:hypothetical protein
MSRELSRRDILSGMTMSHLVSFACGAVFALGLGVVSQSHAAAPQHVYELRMYHTLPGKMDTLKTRFRDHTIEIFNRYHMKSIGYWQPEESPDSLLIYVLQHPSREAANKAWKDFNADPEWQKVKAASEANGKLVEKVDRWFMDPTDFAQMK